MAPNLTVISHLSHHCNTWAKYIAKYVCMYLSYTYRQNIYVCKIKTMSFLLYFASKLDSFSYRQAVIFVTEMQIISCIRILQNDLLQSILPLLSLDLYITSSSWHLALFNHALYWIFLSFEEVIYSHSTNEKVYVSLQRFISNTGQDVTQIHHTGVPLGPQ